MDSALQQALSVAQQHFLRAKHCWDNGRQSEAAIECTKVRNTKGYPLSVTYQPCMAVLAVYAMCVA
jgi:hypothetical protein